MSNTGIIRQLKKNSKEKNESKKRVDTKSFWSFLAIIISLFSVFLQFFYVKEDLRVNLVDGIEKKDSLRYQLIYHNRGNQDATILNSKIELFPKNRKKTSSIEILQRRTPLILSSGKQEYEEMKIPFDFSNYNFKSWNFDTKDTLVVELVFEFLNDNKYRSDKKIVCGWIKLDDKQKIKYFLTELNSIDLDSDRYFTTKYRTEK